MTNADKFKEVFGIYATELWAMPEADFLKWLNADHKTEPQSNGELIRIEDAIQAIKAYLDLCCLTEAKFHKGYEDYTDEIAREIISVIAEPSNNEKYRCYKCSWWDYDQCSQTMYKMNCNGIACKTEPQTVGEILAPPHHTGFIPPFEDELQTERSE